MINSNTKLTTETWLIKAKLKHGDKYDYSKSVYTGAKSKLTITCKIHGDFEQLAGQHASGKGCKPCADKARGIASKDSRESWINKAISKHGDRYNYDNVVYVNSQTKVSITCKIHGDFLQYPAKHLFPRNCPKCANENTRQRCVSTKEEFVSKAKLKHGDKFDYSKVVYVKAQDKVTIICPVHGDFEQMPSEHIKGDCNKCAHIKRTKAKLIPYEQWENEASETHSNKYDYSLVSFNQLDDLVKIICPEHGQFEQKASYHRLGRGCGVCGNQISYDTESYIAKCIEKHGDKYDYSKVVYVNSSTPVIITCPKHGEFKQTATNHLNGSNCNKCSGVHRPTTAEFIASAIAVHGDTYDYSKIVYVKAHDNVIIICKTHGNFSQSPTSHISGHGCEKCSIDKNRLLQPDTKEQFLEKSKAKHGDKYDYSLVVYDNNRSKVKIICPIHKQFTQTAGDHTQGKGCKKCSLVATSEKFMDTKEQFLAKAIATHGDKFDYSEVEYRGNKKKITIICNTCKTRFEQNAGSHISGVGCSKCANYGFKPSLPAILYYLKVETRNQLCYKIGITNRTVQERFTGSDSKKITILSETYYENGKQAYDEEQRILREYKQFKYLGEKLLKQVGNTELFTKDVLLLDGLI